MSNGFSNGFLVWLPTGRIGQSIQQVRVALRTDSLIEAKAAAVEATSLTEWEALAAGDGASTRPHYLAERALAEARGIDYVTFANLEASDLFEIFNRLAQNFLPAGDLKPASPAVTTAVLAPHQWRFQLSTAP